MDFIENIIKTLSNDDMAILKKNYNTDCQYCGGGARNFEDELNVIAKPTIELSLDYVLGYSNLYKAFLQILIGEIRKYIMKDFWNYLQESRQILDVNEAYFMLTNRLILIQTNLNQCIDNPRNKQINEIIFDENLELLISSIEEIQDAFSSINNLSKWIDKNIVQPNKKYTHLK